LALRPAGRKDLWPRCEPLLKERGALVAVRAAAERKKPWPRCEPLVEQEALAAVRAGAEGKRPSALFAIFPFGAKRPWPRCEPLLVARDYGLV